MSDRDTGAADDRAPDDRETSADGTAGSDADGPSEEATDGVVGDAVSDVDLATEDGEPPESDADAPTPEDEAERREARTVPATDGGNGDAGLGEDAAAPDVDESRVFDSLRDEYGPTDFEDIEPEVERQFPGEVDFDHLVTGDVDLVEADGDEPWHPAEESADPDGGAATSDLASGDGSAVGADADSSVAALVRDIRSGAAADSEVEALREALEVEAPRHMDVRLRHVQSRIDDLAAYIETLETFIDEEGTPIQILEQTRDRLENLDGQLDVVKTGLVNARTERQSIEDRLAAVEEQVDAGAGAEHFEAELTQLRQRVDDLAEAVEDGDDATADEVAELRADLADALAERRDLRESVAAVREEQERIREVFESIAGEFSGH